MKKILPFLVFAVFFSCEKKQEKKAVEFQVPKVENDGKLITFYDKTISSEFQTQTVTGGSVNGNLVALGQVGATILKSDSGSSSNIVLFENSDLASNYTQIIEHQINIRQIANINVKKRQIELARAKDLNQHGAMSGAEVLNAETALSMEMSALSNEKASIIEHESMLKSGGFDPKVLQSAKKGTAYIVSDIPENEIKDLKVGTSCSIEFNAYPNEKFHGRIDAIVDRVDFATRMVKVRIGIDNSQDRLKVGMYANISFGLKSANNTISVPKTSILTALGKNYAFVQKDDTHFERRELQIGEQIGDQIVVFSGLNKGDKVVVKGLMQLKGLSFGY